MSPSQWAKPLIIGGLRGGFQTLTVGRAVSTVCDRRGVQNLGHFKSKRQPSNFYSDRKVRPLIGVLRAEATAQAV